MAAVRPSLMPTVLEMFKGMDLDVSDQNNYPQFNIVASQDVEEVLITTASHNHHSTTILPHYLAKWTNKDYVLDLVKARYDEHLAEDLVLQHADGSDGSRYQELLVKHRLERAKLEVQLYVAAIAKQSQYSPIKW